MKQSLKGLNIKEANIMVHGYNCGNSGGSDNMMNFLLMMMLFPDLFQGNNMLLMLMLMGGMF